MYFVLSKICNEHQYSIFDLSKLMLTIDRMKASKNKNNLFFFLFSRQAQRRHITTAMTTPRTGRATRSRRTLIPTKRARKLHRRNSSNSSESAKNHYYYSNFCAFDYTHVVIQMWRKRTRMLKCMHKDTQIYTRLLYTVLRVCKAT